MRIGKMIDKVMETKVSDNHLLKQECLTYRKDVIPHEVPI